MGGGNPRTIDDLPTSPNNQFRDYFIRNRIEKLVPLNWDCAPQTLKIYKILRGHASYTQLAMYTQIIKPGQNSYLINKFD